MSYRATLNGEVFFNTNSNSQSFGLISARLQLKAGAAGLFSFSVPNCNAAYDRFRLISDYIDVYRNDEIIFSGRVSSVSMDFDTTMRVEAEGLLSILNDTVFRPITHEGTFLELVRAIIASHNSQVEQEKRLVIGNISVPDGACYRAYENYESTFSRIQDLVDSFGGYPSIRRSSSGNLIFDWMYNISTHATQKIELGENVIDISKSSSSENVITVLIPLGAEIEDEETGERSRLTIASVNDGKDYIELSHAENKIVGVYTWDDITVPTNLLRTGERWLEQQSMLHTTVNVTNIDLANTGESVGNFRICTLVDVTSRPHGLNNQSFECLGLELNLLSPDDDKMTLGIVLDGFSIKAQKEAKLNAIILEKINADYATNERLNAIRRAIGTTLESYSTAINQNSESITLLATHVTEETARIDNDIQNARGVTITGSTMHYLATSAGSGVTRETTGWTTEIQQMTATNKYLWTYVTYTYGSGATRDTDPVITGTYGEKGEKGDIGVGISNITEYYALNNSTTAPADSEFTTGIKTPTASNRYLWNYELVTYTNNTTKKLDKHVVLMYSQDGAAGKGVASIEEYYALSTNTTAPADSSFSTTVKTPTSTNKYLWNYEVITYTDSTSTKTDKHIIGVYGDKGQDGTSISISNTSVKYQKGTSGTTKPTGTWQTSVPSVGQGEYLWTQTIVNYSDSSSTESYSVSRMGTNGTNGKDGTDGTSPTVTGTTTKYQQSTSGTTVPTGTWETTPPSAVAGRFMWTQTTVTYSDGATAVSYNVSKNGTNGVGISNITEYYALNNSTTAPDDSSFSTGVKTPTASNRYLWNYELVTYTDSTSKKLDKHIVLMYSEDGAAGKGITSIAEYYALSTTTTAPADSSFSTSVKTVTATNKYLWNYELITYTDSTTTKTSKHIIGVYGDKGQDGQDGQDGADGKDANIWTTSTAPTTPNYTFTISDLSGGSGTPRVGDIILYSYYRYTISSVSTSTVLAGSQVSLRGATGPTGTAGGRWYTGNKITGTSTTATIFSGSGISAAVVGDMYLNTDTNNTYRCTVAGAASAAKWVYADNIKGAKGDQGPKGDDGKSLTGITEYYARNNSTTAPADSAFNTTVKTPTASEKYVWNYELLSWDDNGTTSTTQTTKHIIAIYGDKGNTGKSLTGITEYYAVNNSTTAPADSAFDTSVKAPTSSNKYLWNYEVMSWNDNGTTSTTKTDKHIAAVYGDKGTQGDQGYSIVASVARSTFTEAQWNTYGTIGHTENWSSTSSIRNNCRIGDLFLIVGTATDTGKAHELVYKSTTASGDLKGTCIAHTYSEKGEKGDQGDQGNGYVFIAGTQTAATGAWTGTTSEITELTEGTQILYHLPYAGSGNATLNLTLAGGGKTGAKECYFSGTTRLSTQYGAGAMIAMMYDGSAWRVVNPYTNSNTYDRTRYSNAIKAVEAISASRIIVGASNGYKHAAAGVSFDTSYPILWASSAIAANATGTNNYLTIPSATLRNNKSGISLTPYTTAFLVGTLSGSTFTISQEVFANAPTSKDGKYYIPIGMLYSAYQVYFDGGIPDIYEYGDNGFQRLYGAQGVSITKVIPLYYAKNNATKPAKPTSEVTSTSTAANVWTTQIPSLTDTYKYMYTCNQVYYSDGSLTWSDVTYDQISTTAVDVQRRMTTAETSINQNSDNITLLASRVETKRAVFQSVPVPPYDKGDLWYRGVADDDNAAVTGSLAIPGQAVPGVGGDIYICTTSKAAGAEFSESDWEPTFQGQLEDVRTEISSARIEIDNARSLIDLKVSKTDYNAAEIALMINEAGSSIKLNADHINLNGVVTANENFKINLDGSLETIGAKNIVKTDYIGSYGNAYENITYSEMGKFDIPYFPIEESSAVNVNAAGFKTYANISNHEYYLAMGPIVGYTGHETAFVLSNHKLILGAYCEDFTLSTRCHIRLDNGLYLDAVDGGNGFVMALVHGEATLTRRSSVFAGGNSVIVRISSTSPSAETSSSGMCMTYKGAIYAHAFNKSSDRSLKTDINKLDKIESSKFIYSLDPVSYRYLSDNSKIHHGFIAQDVEKTIDQRWGIVTTFNGSDKQETYEAKKAIDYTEIIADLVATVQSLNKRLQVLEGGNQ